ncbi:Ndufs4, NADH dehydrogenase Fe-S protein 4 [Serpula lacrymans var. lacrymans S7.3]|uniref:NADH dehydrogenase [ubiquinone] iron-sulfur protein 4, mitochondrial n=2 Tax=Serpula lacrymans var. lacrymans TaxID=341189 RepID=F8Q1R0_SERL3|nr:NADH dehydrogenase Fe-S protein 4 [Serpula lacrymans var. lacrymans S7.9]EGN98238.1 Ndufs4, NADH dehydrogenase Fe-S protein 4 [Serpula lacrymans var. lacrymans S7.3]EGO23811.1 NADH dehydrogenase Fe-S protein 4 [Serpula lacrymans var. lacrymans S7.9]
MSLLRACQQGLSKHALNRPLALHSRGLASDTPAQPVQTRDQSEKESTQISEPINTDVLTADVISGAPAELRHRAVRIFQPTRNTMQSGSGKTERWRIDWEILQGAGRWENPLMGWASSADYMQGTRLSFRSKEDAVHFAEKQGWDYYVQTPSIKRIPPKNYSENYVYKPNKLRIMRTK